MNLKNVSKFDAERDARINNQGFALSNVFEACNWVQSISKKCAIEFADLHQINIGQSSIDLHEDWKEKLIDVKAKLLYLERK